MFSTPVPDITNILHVSRIWVKKKSSSITGPEGPRGFQEIKVPRFRDNGTRWW